MCKSGCLLLTLRAGGGRFSTCAAAQAAPRVREIVAECGGWQRDGRGVVRRDGGGGDARAAARDVEGGEAADVLLLFDDAPRAPWRVLWPG